MSPTPPPPLAYPPTLWLILSYNVVPYTDYTEVLVTSDVALHLGLYYSHIQPTLTDRQRKRRGQTYVRDKHWQFTPVGVLEQLEAGDTTTHTYHIPSELLPSGAWFKFEHDYPEQWKCPVCGATSLPRFQAPSRFGSEFLLISRYFCKACYYAWPQAAVRNLSTSHSTSPFFYAPRALSPRALLFADFWYNIYCFAEVHSDYFPS